MKFMPHEFRSATDGDLVVFSALLVPESSTGVVQQPVHKCSGRVGDALTLAAVAVSCALSFATKT